VYILLDHRERRFRINNLNIRSGFEIPSFKRNYDAAFGKVADILRRYGIVENPRNLRFRFTLCMQEFFDSFP
jgi:hypothetical protein